MKMIPSVYLFLCMAMFSTAKGEPPLNSANTLSKLPAWSDLPKYQSKAGNAPPMRNRRIHTFLGANIGLKNGYGVDFQAGVKLSRYLFTGARIFAGRLNSNALVRNAHNPTESVPDSTEFQSLLNSPEQWNTFIPEIGLGTNTQILSLIDSNWSEVAWFGVGKPIFGSRTGWTVSIEGGINHLFKKNGNLGLSFRGRYTYGWISAGSTKNGNIPVDWSNFSLGVIYLW
jgi:hypothetical protein